MDNLTALRDDTRFLVFGESSNTAYGDTDLDRNLNNHYDQAHIIAIESSGEWRPNDYTATTNLVASQSKYAIPSDLLTIDYISVKQTDSDEYRICSEVDETEMDESFDEFNPSNPTVVYRGQYFEIYMAGDIQAVTDGIKIHYTPELTKLSSASDEPILPRPLRRFLSIGAAIDYCLANEMHNKANMLEQRFQKAELELRNYYANRKRTTHTRLTVADTDQY